MNNEIKRITASEILDSRGNMTVRATVLLADGTRESATAPSGASTGKYEAYELRDGDMKRMHGKGCLKAVGNVNAIISKELTGVCADCQAEIDARMRELDGTPNLSVLGANAVLAVSLACARAAAASAGTELYRYIGGLGSAKSFPVPMMNMINGGKHASNNLDIQEFMTVPTGAKTVTHAVEMCATVYQELKRLLQSRGMSVSVGDEGGFAPNLKREEDALQLLCDAISAAGYVPGQDVSLAVDAAASEWAQPDGTYLMPKSGKRFSAGTMLRNWKRLRDSYPLISLEDGAGEDDTTLWQSLTGKLGSNMMLVGDDLIATNPQRLTACAAEGCANAVLVKPNQIGTLSDTLKLLAEASLHGYKVVISHRSGETEDTFIADLAAAVNAPFIKTGAPARGERTSKYNRLLEIYGA